MPPHAGAAMTLPPISIEKLRKKDEVINFPVTGPECQTHVKFSVSRSSSKTLSRSLFARSRSSGR